MIPIVEKQIQIEKSKYIAMCNHNGILINDPVLSRLDEKKYWFSIADSNILSSLRYVTGFNIPAFV